ncbi:hypothetical protein [Salmonella phage SSBI34]|nr:hypothetical protein [Salmonella phage SSBI34]
MIPFPLFGGNTVAPIPPVVEGVQLYTGTSITDENGQNFVWEYSLQEWVPVPPTERAPDPDHPLHTFINGGKVGTDGSFRRYIPSTQTWQDITTLAGEPAQQMNPLITDTGLNIGPSIVWHFPLTVGNQGVFWENFLGVDTLGRPDLMDLYLIGNRGQYGVPPSWESDRNAVLVATQVRRDKFWSNGYNSAFVNDSGQLWVQGDNLHRQYGPWRENNPTYDRDKRCDWQVLEGIDGNIIQDMFLASRYFIIATTDGRFITRGANEGQFSDNPSAIMTDFTEIPPERFGPGFKRFWQQGVVKPSSDVTKMNTVNTCWYLCDEGLRTFGDSSSMPDGRPQGVDYGPQLSHIRPVGHPNRTDAPRELRPQSIYASGRLSILWDNPTEAYTCYLQPSSFGSLAGQGSRSLRVLSKSAIPIGKQMPLRLQFNKEATLIHGYNDQWYASGTSNVDNGLSVSTTPATFVDQRIPRGLVRDIKLRDLPNQKSIALRDNGQSIIIADLANGSNFFGNGSFWREGPTKGPAQSGYVETLQKINRETSRSNIVMKSVAGNGTRWSAQDLSNIYAATWTGRNYSTLYVTDYATDAPKIFQESSNVYASGPNTFQMFQISPETNYLERRNIRVPAVNHWNPQITELSPQGDIATTYGSILIWDIPNKKYFVYGKNWLDVAGGQPVMTNSTYRDVTQTVNLPNFLYFIRAHVSYSDSEGSLPQPMFMYRGTDNLIYAAGRNTTGCLGTGSAPATREEERWTFQPIQGSDVFGDKPVTVFSGIGGNASCLLFQCEDKIYGLGLPNSMGWNQGGTIADPFFPGFNRPLYEITHLKDMEDIYWTRPIDK